ncbi:uncharacterized protein LOC126567336 [Anopheles maculipalpis]|uniref:uncharacterized protein LOC126567336 n=1 Tax=Anopheles maculipalpis TaxID=1496333 RepID=UPI002159034D|nr:uncharacterized protein LOC126567336 [Anopheles maculipalpis]
MIYQSGGEKHELGTAFLVIGEMRKREIGWWPINERMCRLRIRGRFFNLSIINVHSPHLGSTDDDKDSFYTQLEREYDRCPQHDVKIVIGDFNAQVGREEVFKPTIGSFSAHQLTNDNGLRLVNFASSKHMTIRSTFFQHEPRFSYTWRSPLQTYSQIDHVLIDGRHFSDIIDVKTYRGANVDSDHFLVMVKLRQKLSVVSNQRSNAIPSLYMDRLRRADVAEGYATALGEALSDDNPALPLGDHWCMMERAISTAAELKIGRLPRRQRRNGSTKSALVHYPRRILQLETRQNVENYKRLRRQQTLLFQDKKRRFEESDEKLQEQPSQSGDVRSFYRRLKEARSGFAPKTAMCRDAYGYLLTDERKVIERWKCYFEGHLNGAETGELDASSRTSQRQHQHSNNISDGNSAEDEVPPPSLDEYASAIRQLKSYKAAGSDGLPAELFKIWPEKNVPIFGRL